MPAKDEPPSRFERGCKKTTKNLKKWFIPKVGGKETDADPLISPEQTNAASSQPSEVSNNRSISSMGVELGGYRA